MAPEPCDHQSIPQYAWQAARRATAAPSASADAHPQHSAPSRPETIPYAPPAAHPAAATPATSRWRPRPPTALAQRGSSDARAYRQTRSAGQSVSSETCQSTTGRSWRKRRQESRKSCGNRAYLRRRMLQAASRTLPRHAPSHRAANVSWRVRSTNPSSPSTPRYALAPPMHARVPASTHLYAGSRPLTLQRTYIFQRLRYRADHRTSLPALPIQVRQQHQIFKLIQPPQPLFGPVPQRELIRDLQHAGFEPIPGGGKGSHRKFIHPRFAGAVTISGHDGDDAKHYQERQVRRTIEEVQQ
eukprot:TRINITY_DN11545_c0_g1_i1.p1 TRINITY_DN11545_c0_g1~~TRINITY_DN11545_c0_g1_i1.p1  ORF type:complete len:300 (-),score=-59.61 TRINITY_DN11545_c0_g1_i1:28-927(-)